MDDLSRTSLPFWFAAGGILAAIVGQLKVEGDLKDIDAMPKVKWWQQRSLGHLMEVAETHRSKFPKSAWRSVWVADL